MGFMNPTIGLNATFAKSMPQKGSVAFLSQSGALQTAILDWSQREQVGFSAIVSTGSMLDVGWGDLIYHFGDDPHTKSILLYMESVGDARSFLSAAREIALSKPIIVIKAGRSEAASRAAASHTGALTGSDDVLEAAFRRCGVLRVQNIADLFYMAEVLEQAAAAARPAAHASSPMPAVRESWRPTRSWRPAESLPCSLPNRCTNWTAFFRRTGATAIRWTCWPMPMQSVL